MALEVCGAGWNCSTTIHFVGPGYKCETLAEGRDDKMKKLGDASPPSNFNLSLLAPDGNHTYYAITDQGDYGSPQIELGGPKNKPVQPRRILRISVRLEQSRVYGLDTLPWKTSVQRTPKTVARRDGVMTIHP